MRYYRGIRFDQIDDVKKVLSELDALYSGLDRIYDQKIKPLRMYLRSGKVEKVLPNVRQDVKVAIDKIGIGREGLEAVVDVLVELEDFVRKNR